ncbi:MAG TPA: acyl-CoA dehydrogenase family protein [Gemmataceae bacterium]|nr:acyl-CoA dehydrogenase family protein [Gemmataceae bacterium]
MDFEVPEKLRDLQRRVRQFLLDEVIPVEPQESDTEGLPARLVAELQQKAKRAGLWGPQLPRDYGGLGLETLAMCLVFEEAGRSTLGPLALHCSAPDEGNMHLLLQAATPEQRRKYLEPLARGETRSCFAMTEPAPGAGSDPTLMQTRAEKQGDRWIINGRKWFTTGARGAAFAIVAAVTDPSVPAKHGVTLFLVDAGTPGYEVVRSIPTMTGEGQGGHCEVKLVNCTVPESQILGGLGNGFRLMQVRLGPARLTHCMRWLGAAARATEIATQYACQRQAFGKHLSEHQAVQWMLADSVIDMHASRLMVLEAAWKLEKGEEARQETSICKVFVAEAVGRVIDRSIQICGALGISRDLILERFYRDVRAFRIYDGPSEVHRMVIARQILKEAGLGPADKG